MSDPLSGPVSDPLSGPTSDGPLRAVFRTAVRDVVVLTVVVTVLGAAIGGAVAGTPGLWGGLLGGAIALVAAATTPVTMLATARSSLTTAMAAVAGGWLVKTAIVLIAGLALRGVDMDRKVFVIVVAVGLLGSVAVDARAVAAGRVPYVDGPLPPAAGDPDATPEP